MEGRDSAIKYLKRLAMGIVCLLILIALVVIICDPFYHYHAPLFGMKAVLEERDYEVMGTIDHFSYDAILLGDSLVENTNTGWFDELYRSKAIKAIRAGGSNADLLYYLDRAYEKHELKQVFYCIDKASLCADTEPTFWENDYYYLLDKNPLNDWKYLWNKDVLLKKIPIQLAYNTLLDYDPGEAYDWYETKTFSAEAMIQHYAPQEGFDEIQPLSENFNENIAMLRERILAHPETEFYLFYPPASMLWWDKELREGSLSADYEMLRSLSAAFGDCENVRLYGFFAAEEYAGLSLYMDVVHFSPEINRKLLEDMAEGKYVMDDETVEAELWKLHEMISDFSGGEILTYYPDAHPVASVPLP